MSRLNKTDLELLYSGQTVDLSDSKGRWAYLGGEFTDNPDDYVEALIYTAGEDFLESSIVDPEDYKFTKGQNIKLNTGTILRKLGYDRGRFIVKYNFLRKVAGSYENILVDKNNIRYTGDFDPTDQEDRDKIGDSLFIKEYKYYIHEISPSRKEVRLVSEFIQEPENNQRYLRDFYDMQRTRKRVASIGDEGLGIKFRTTTGENDPGQSLDLGFDDENIEFLPAMEQGTLMINKAFVTKITTPELPVPFGRGSSAPFKEIESANLVASFAIEDISQALETITGDYALSKLKEAFVGRGMKDDTSDIEGITQSEGGTVRVVGRTFQTHSTMNTIQQLDIEKLQAHEYNKEGSPSVEIISNSQLPVGSTRTYTWEVFGYDRDGRTADWLHHNTIGWDPIRVDTSNSEGDVRILPDGYGGTGQQGLIYTDHNVVKPEGKENPGSKIAIELHSKDMHVGVRLTIENDVGQKDTLIIPAFLNTE